MLRTLPVREPDRLVLLTANYNKWPAKVVEDLEGSTFQTPGGMNATHSLAEPAYKYIAEHNDVFDRVVAYSANNGRSNIGRNGKADVATVQPVSGDFFDGMGIALPLRPLGSSPLVSLGWKRESRGTLGA
jgi:hypothetical protein